MANVVIQLIICMTEYVTCFGAKKHVKHLGNVKLNRILCRAGNGRLQMMRQKWHHALHVQRSLLFQIAVKAIKAVHASLLLDAVNHVH